ncbi:hypothetical protein BWI17_07435 [Betaproteobacteria bacterium GR16-43]|nr:hypothetical protein BWI17_07435 [Betaproteobacteria bacterium GR16-43]
MSAAVHRFDAIVDERPGRACPSAYRYSPKSMDRAPEIACDALYIAGGLYGNVEALETLQAMVAAEPGAQLAFNGDFHWFDVVPADFERVASAALAHHALRGNVETEIAGEDSGVGCGCAYPADVADAEVARSNTILDHLRETARAFPDLRKRQGELPMNLVARVGEARVGLVHGDAASLAGWGFAHDQLDAARHQRWLESAFADANVDIFASSHTCLPACRAFPFGTVINNGAAGMPNFSGTGHGIVTRIARAPAPMPTLYGVRVRDVYVDAVALRFDERRWKERFLAAWPPGSPAHESYYLRILQGPRFTVRQAAPRTAQGEQGEQR